MFFKKKKKLDVMTDERLDSVAIITDGNGRWATKRGLPRELGHKQGAVTFRKILKHCEKIGLKCLTVYAFSTENWKRSADEVGAIMGLLKRYLLEAVDTMEKDHIRLRFFGDMGPIAPELQALAHKTDEISDQLAPGDFQANICLNYGGRDEIVHAVNTLLAADKKSVSEADVAAALYTAHSPDPDLVIRTGGDYRISNFLLWQSAYAEYYFTPTLWPDIDEKELYRAFSDFCKRHRRFGGLGE